MTYTKTLYIHLKCGIPKCVAGWRLTVEPDGRYIFNTIIRQKREEIKWEGLIWAWTVSLFLVFVFFTWISCNERRSNEAQITCTNMMWWIVPDSVKCYHINWKKSFISPIHQILSRKRFLYVESTEHHHMNLTSAFWYHYKQSSFIWACYLFFSGSAS